MSLLDLIKRPFERIGTNLENYMGGLLGEDVEGMTPEERRRLRQRAIMAISEGMATMTPVSSTLREAADEEMARRQRMAQRRQAEQRMGAAQQASSQIAGRLLGGAPIPTAPGPAAGDELTGVNVQSQYRQDPMGAMQRAMTPAGVDAMQINPFLQPMVQQAMAPPAAKQYDYRVVEGVGLVAANKADPNDSMVVQRIQPQKEEKFQILTPEETARMGYAPGTVVQRAPNGELKVSQAPTTQLDPRGFNDRQRSGANVLQDAAINYAANLTGLDRATLSTMTPAQIEQAMIERGGRVTQGMIARGVRGIPFVGEGILGSINADLMAAATAGGSGIAMIQNPTGPITTPDVEIGKLQFPSPIYPLEVQAQMLRSVLEQASGGQSQQVEQYDAQGNLIGSDRRGATGRF